ncbi:MAG: hypothetical protein PWP43_1080 [Bacillota bacterium]|nr:hypothetical protein [Bacillota bacterium]
MILSILKEVEVQKSGMDCLDCGNCRKGETVYYCPARNDFVIVDGITRIKERKTSGSSGEHERTERRKKLRRERGSLRGAS